MKLVRLTFFGSKPYLIPSKMFLSEESDRKIQNGLFTYVLKNINVAASNREAVNNFEI